MSDHLLSVIVPVYNEARYLEQVVRYLHESPCPIQREFIFVDDCSTDNSRAILERLRPEFGFTLLPQSINRGKGAAVSAGIRQAKGNFVIIQDSDLELDARDVPGLLQPLLENAADVVYGSRFKKSGEQVHRTYHYLGNRVLTMLSNLCSGLYLTDMETCYKLFRADILKAMQLRSERFGVEVELTAYVAKTAARVLELPIRYYPRTTRQGKKINWRDGVAAIYHIAIFNFFTSEETAFRDLPAHYHMPSD